MAQRHCASAGVSPRRRKMSLKSTSSGWMGEGSSPLTLVTAGSIRSQVTKREIYWRRLSLPWGCGGSPPGVCVWYMRSLRKDTFSWHMVRSYLNHANRRAHTGSNKPRQQRTSEIIYIWLWYAVCGERACVGINFFFFFFSNKQQDVFSFPRDRFTGNGTRTDKEGLRGGRKTMSGLPVSTKVNREFSLVDCWLFGTPCCDYFCQWTAIVLFWLSVALPSLLQSHSVEAEWWVNPHGDHRTLTMCSLDISLEEKMHFCLSLLTTLFNQRLHSTQ